MSFVAQGLGDQLLWSANHETGDLSQWYANQGGGEFNSGSAVSTASQDHAHSGSWSAKLRISTPPESGVRLFRWQESKSYPELYYTAWYFFPEHYSVQQYWNVFQWKSKTPRGNVDAFFQLNVGNRPNGAMYFSAYDWQRRINYSQSVKDIPVGQWVKIEAFYKCAGDKSGQVTFWQDGTQILNIPNVQTRYPDGDCQWSVNNYSNGISPSPATIYIDDATVSMPPGANPAPTSQEEVGAPATPDETGKGKGILLGVVAIAALLILMS